MIVRGGGLCWQNLGDTSPSRSLGSLVSAPRLTVMKPECVFLPLSLFQDSCEKQCFCHASYSSSGLDSAPGLSHASPSPAILLTEVPWEAVVFKAEPILLTLSWWPLKGTRKSVSPGGKAQRRGEDGPQEEDAGCVRMKGWAPVGGPSTPVLCAAQSDVWVPPVGLKSHLAPHFSSFTTVIIQLSFPF